jgi:hypothetical protein
MLGSLTLHLCLTVLFCGHAHEMLNAEIEIIWSGCVLKPWYVRVVKQNELLRIMPHTHSIPSATRPIHCTHLCVIIPMICPVSTRLPFLLLRFCDHLGFFSPTITRALRCFFQPSSAIAARPARPHWQHQESKTQTSGPKEGTMLDTHPPCKCHMYAMQYTAWRNAYMLHKCNLQTAVRDTHEKYATSSNALPSKTDRKPNPCMTRNRKDRNTR